MVGGIGAVSVSEVSFSIIRLMANIRPNDRDVKMMDEPPREIRGSGCPVTNIAPVQTPMWMRAWMRMMSGSPIIQNQALVGAVTHVLVNDPTKGYGIFAETMLTNSNKIFEAHHKNKE